MIAMYTEAFAEVEANLHACRNAQRKGGRR